MTEAAGRLAARRTRRFGIGRVPCTWSQQGLALSCTAFLVACSGDQSALQPDGRNAREIAVLWWSMLVAGAAVFGLILGLLIYVLYRPPERRLSVSATAIIVSGGVILPVVALTILIPFGVTLGTSAIAALPEDALRIKVTGRQWWWEIEYLDREPHQRFTTANELAVPVGRPVELVLTAADVIHSFWAPRLAGKQDLVPGKTTRLVVEAEEPGAFRAQCAEYCGLAHAQMALYTLALPPAEFEAWMERQRSPAKPPEGELQQRGAAAFATSGCILCHAVRGHDAWGRVGPDLTHVGGRRTFGAGLLRIGPENFADWIAHNQALKPGNRMPEFSHLDRETRLAIGAYLESLK